ncbi:substrate-binding domain-containing protein [bacterium]|nr:substrate-binding domain-containing protein [bacterium]
MEPYYLGRMNVKPIHNTNFSITRSSLTRRVWLRQVSAGVLLASGAGLLKSCAAPAGRPLTIGVAFDTLQTEYWVASIKTMEAELKKHGYKMLQAVADNDANRQLEQVNNFIAQGVDGIIIAPKDGQSVLSMIRRCNRANIPVVLYNRPPAQSDTQSVTVVADNYQITKNTIQYMVEQARKSGKKYKGMILIGDLGDDNSIKRRDGYFDVIRAHPDVVEDTAQVPTEWDNEKALARMTNAMQAHPDIDFIFTSSDLHLPAIVQVLKSLDKYHKIGETGHVMLAGFDGDNTAYQMMVDGYMDADGVQDMYFECEKTVQAIVDMREGKEVPPLIKDPGFVIHQGNLQEKSSRMWGAQFKPQA